MSSSLEYPSLILNQQWMPVNVTSVREALTLAFTGRAQIVCPETYAPYDFGTWLRREVRLGGHTVQAVRYQLEAPEVVVLKQYAKLPPSSVVFNRRNLNRRDGNLCQYCGKQLDPREMTIDHITPLSRGGLTAWENCVIACHRCNGKKANLSLKEANMKLRQKPTRPNWSPLYSICYRKKRPRSWDNFIPAAWKDAVAG